MLFLLHIKFIYPDFVFPFSFPSLSIFQWPLLSFVLLCFILVFGNDYEFKISYFFPLEAKLTGVSCLSIPLITSKIGTECDKIIHTRTHHKLATPINRHKHARTYARTHRHTCTWRETYINTYLCMSVKTYIYIYICVCVCMCVCVCVCVIFHTFAYIYIAVCIKESYSSKCSQWLLAYSQNTHTCIKTRAHTHTHTHTHIYIYIYICMHT